MKKIISAVLALTVLLSLCACNGDVEGTETSDVSSTPVISIDPSSMLSSDAPSSDIPSNEGTKPDENVSSEPETPLTPEEEEEQARIQTALNNPGASLDYDVFLVDAPEGEEEWKLLRYNMEEEELYEEFSFSPKKATGSYTVEFTDEYVGNILKVTFEDGMSCYIDVEKNKFYNSSEFKGLSKTLSVTKRNIAVTKNGQYEVWTTSHPDYGKVYYSELNEDDNLLLTVFLKNNKYTFTSYNYETKTFKNLFTISEKPEVKLLNDGWFIYKTSSGDTEDGSLYISNVKVGARELLTTEYKDVRQYKEDKYSGITVLTNEIFDSLIEESRKGNVTTVADRLWWWKQNEQDLHMFSYVMGGENIYFSIREYAYTDLENSFVNIGEETILKLYPKEREYSWQMKEEAIFLCTAEDRQVIEKAIKKNVGDYYVLPGGTECIAFEKNRSKWIKTALLSEKQEIVIKRDVLANPCIAYDNSIWILEPFYASGKMVDHYKFYRYDPETQKTYLLTTYTEDISRIRVSHNVYLTLAQGNDGKDYFYARVGLSYDVYNWHFSPETLELVGWSNFYDGEKYISDFVATDEEDIRICEDGSLEVWKEHPEYGVVYSAYRLPNTKKAIFLFAKPRITISYGYEGYPTVVAIYDYDTAKLEQIFSVDEDRVEVDFIDERYMIMRRGSLESIDSIYQHFGLWVYDIKNQKLNKLTDEPVRILHWDRYNFNGKYGFFYVDINEQGAERYCFYDLTGNKTYVFYEKAEFMYRATLYTEDAFFLRELGHFEEPLSPLPLYMCTLNKTVCISEKTLHYCVMEDQGYVMYYEEQEDGSFEWKYYYF